LTTSLGVTMPSSSKALSSDTTGKRYVSSIAIWAAASRQVTCSSATVSFWSFTHSAREATGRFCIVFLDIGARPSLNPAVEVLVYYWATAELLFGISEIIFICSSDGNVAGDGHDVAHHDIFHEQGA
jgi:hypothetical protein